MRSDTLFPMIEIQLPDGEITSMTVPWLFKRLQAEKKTGTVVFTLGAATKKVHFADGDIIFASSSLPEDWLGEWMVRAGTITREQCDASSALVQETAKKQGTILVEQGTITPKELVAGVRFQVAQIIVSLFNWRSGRYAFDDGPLSNHDIIPLKMSTGNLIIEGLRGLEWNTIRRSLPSLKMVLRPVDDPSMLFQWADLEQDHIAVFSLIDGAKSIEELCSLSALGDFNTLKAVYTLLALRMVEKGELKTEAEMKFAREAVRQTIAAKEKAPVERKTVAALTREALQEAFDRRGDRNFYELLGIGRNAAAQEVKRAYFEMAKLYHPDMHFSPEMSDMKKQLAALFDAVHEAYATLADQAKRDRYDRELAKGTAAHQGTQHERPVQPDTKQAAAIRSEEGMKQFNQGNFWGAEESFLQAVHLDPENAEYVFQQGLALSRMPRRGHDAEDHFLKAIAMAPSTSVYVLELGSFYVKLGFKAKALAVYQDALKRNPGSEKINEAMRKAGG